MIDAEVQNACNARFLLQRDLQRVDWADAGNRSLLDGEAFFFAEVRRVVYASNGHAYVLSFRCSSYGWQKCLTTGQQHPIRRRGDQSEPSDITDADGETCGESAVHDKQVKPIATEMRRQLLSSCRSNSRRMHQLQY